MKLREPEQECSGSFPFIVKNFVCETGCRNKYSRLLQRLCAHGKSGRAKRGADSAMGCQYVFFEFV